MHMSFWFSQNLGNFLFDGFVVETVGAFVATCVGLSSIAVLLEVIKFWRVRATKRSAVQIQSSLNGGSETSGLLSGFRLRTKIERFLHITAEVLLYFTQESFNWIIMLAVMGYNGYIFLSVLAGAGLGYALFGEAFVQAKIQHVKVKAGLMSCDECRVQQDITVGAPGLSSPPTESHHSNPDPASTSDSSSPGVIIHHSNASTELA